MKTVLGKKTEWIFTLGDDTELKKVDNIMHIG